MCFEFLLGQDPFVYFFLSECFQVILEYGHTDFSAVAIQVIQSISDHRPVILSHNDFGDLIKYGVELIQYPQAFPQSEIFFVTLGLEQ